MLYFDEAGYTGPGLDSFFDAQNKHLYGETI